MRNKLGIAILVLFVILVVVSVYNIGKKNSLANENVDLKEKISSLEAEQQTEPQEDTSAQAEENSENEGETNDNEGNSEENEDKNDDTFEEDIEWFLKNLYTDKSKEKSYNTLKDSATEDLLKSQFGEELPPEDETDGEKGVDNDIKNVEVYGKYSNSSTYKALVEFEIISTYEDKEDSGEKIVEFTIRDKDGKWLVENIEDKAK